MLILKEFEAGACRSEKFGVNIALLLKFSHVARKITAVWGHQK